jgi:anti-sigma factor (TIGR02949 family)
MSSLTCKDFLTELNDYLDNSVDKEVRDQLQQHVNECPNCWVVVDTTQKTLQVYKNTEPQDLPAAVRGRLMAALEKKIGCTSKV